MNEWIEELDTLLALLEDTARGSEAGLVTKARELIRKQRSEAVSEVETIVSSPTDTEILDWLDKVTKERCISTTPTHGAVYANNPVRNKPPQFINLHFNGKGFLANEDGQIIHNSFRDSIAMAMKQGY